MADDREAFIPLNDPNYLDSAAKESLDRLAERARVRFPWNATPVDWPAWVARLEQAQARRIRRRRIRAALLLVAALAITGIHGTFALAAVLDDDRGTAVFFAALTVIAGIWVIDEYRSLRRALRAGVVDVPRRRP